MTTIATDNVNDTPLPTILDRYAERAATFDTYTGRPANWDDLEVTVRRENGTKVWRMAATAATDLVRNEPIRIVRVDADGALVVRDTRKWDDEGRVYRTNEAV